MYDLSECIFTIGEIIDELTIDDEKIAEFKKQYRKILLRSKDENFYLSTIGDFSSGKSTLINAIINRKLLKVAHAATTAVPTYIYRGKSGGVVIKVLCKGGKKYDLTSEEDLSKFEKKYGVEFPQQTDEIISLLTADKALALKIKEVYIELPSDELQNGLCIIDTPGINPGADFAKNHAEITKQILDEQSDAIIILFPADQAYTQSFEKFLKDNAEYFMKDAIFVVTMMDRVDESERDDVIQFVKTNLRNNFHLDDPQVLSCAAMLSGSDPYWTDNFKEFEKILMDSLAQNRQRIVTERLIKLSNDLLNSIQNEITIQKSGLENALAVFKSHSVPNLSSVLSESKKKAADELSDILSEHNSEVSREAIYLEDKIMQKINSGLNACDSRSGVTQYVKVSMSSDIESVCGEIYSISTNYTRNMNSTLSSAIQGMVEELKVYYGELGSVMSESTSLAAPYKQITVADRLTGLSGMIGDYEGKIDLVTSIGGAGIAAIVLAGLGPLGLVIGGIAALIGGDRLFVDFARNKVRESVSGKISDIASSVKQDILNGMQKNYNTAINIMEEKSEEFISQYRPVYSSLRKKFNSGKREITAQIQHSENIQSRVLEVLQQISEIQGEIAV